MKRITMALCLLSFGSIMYGSSNHSSHEDKSTKRVGPYPRYNPGYTGLSSIYDPWAAKKEQPETEQAKKEAVLQNHSANRSIACYDFWQESKRKKAAEEAAALALSQSQAVVENEEKN